MRAIYLQFIIFEAGNVSIGHLCNFDCVVIEVIKAVELYKKPNRFQASDKNSEHVRCYTIYACI